MTWDLYADELAKQNQAMGTAPAGSAPVGAFEGFGKGTGMLAMRELAKFPKAVSMGLSVLPYAVDLARGTTDLTDKWFKTHDEVFGSAVDYWTPKPNEVGLAAEVVGPLIGTLTTAMLNPLGTVAATQMNATTEVGVKPGVSTAQAVGVGAVQGVGFGLGLKAPLWGSNVWNRAAIGGGVNLAQGVVTRGISQAILGDNPAAHDFPAFGGKEMLLDTAIGAAMGALFHMVPSARKEGDKAYKDLKDTVAAKVEAWRDTVKPSDLDALLVMRQAEHLEGQTMPGRPTSPRAVTDNVDRVVKAIEQLNTTGRVDVEVPPTVAKPPNVEQFAARTAQEIAPDTALAPVVEKLQRAYIEQGPEVGQAELVRAIEAGKADGTIPPEIATPQMADALHGELTTRAEEFKAQQEAAQPPFVPDPVRQAQAEEIVRAMREEAGRIAAEEGLPKTPEVVEPVHAVIARDFEAAGRTPEEAGKAALLISEWFKKAAQDIAASTGKQVDPDALFARYYAGTKRFGASPDAALKQDGVEGRTYPAHDIQAYKPQDGKDSKGRRLLMNERVALGRPVPTNSKGAKGERLTFTIFDRSQGRGTPVGFVIAEVDANGKFAALRNIKIRDDIRSMGLGEKAVATMLAHNGAGYSMDVVDITHAGGDGIGSKTDALPFWKKVGTRLVNYSRDPDIQMDGILSLEDYLGARNGQGTGEGRGRGRTGAGQADTRGTGGPGRPDATDRAELARLLGEGSLYQGPSLWYHSALARAIDNVDAKAQPVKGWKDWLKGQVAKGGIKADEIKWTGLEEWLDLQQGKVTKEALQTFMREGGVRVEEVELGKSVDQRFTHMNDGQLAAEYERIMGGSPELDHGPDWRQHRGDVIASLSEVVQHDINPAAGIGQPVGWGMVTGGGSETRFNNFQLPGAKEGGYRELALVLPARTDPEALGAAMRNAKTQAELAAAQAQHKRDYRVPQAHSMGEAADINRLAHIRFNERAGTNGERVLFIEEIQSDWAQQGKKEGFLKGKLSDEPMKAEINNSADKPYWEVRTQNGTFVANVVDIDPRTSTPEQAIAKAKAIALRRESEGVPQRGVVPGPFVGKTEAWVGLALKRMIRYAAENGFDRIAWTTGEQQAARYDLGKQVDRIDYSKDDDGTYSFSAIKNGRELIQKEGLTIEQIENLVGKEVAKKMADGEGRASAAVMDEAEYRTLSGLDLKVGGEGMKGFYDQIVPSVAKDVMKKLGGGKVEQVPVQMEPRTGDIESGQWAVHRGLDGTYFVQNTDNGDSPLAGVTEAEAKKWVSDEVGGSQQQMGITITPEMRAKAMESQALFQKPEGASPERGFLSIDPNRKMTIGFLEAADASTAVHEPAHFFLEVMDDLARTEPAMQARMDVLLKDWGLTKEQWDGMNLEERRPFHEQFATGFEQYLMTNKAPNERLRDVFRSFRDWLLAVYKSATSLNIKVSQEVRNLWDKMLNSEAAETSTPPPAEAASTDSPPPPRVGEESPMPAAKVGAPEPPMDLPTLVRDSAEWATMRPEVEAAGLPPTPKNMLDVDAVAIALQIDEGRVHALAKEHAQHDRLFMSEIRRMIDGYKNGETVPGGEGNQAAQGEATAPADAIAGPAGRPAEEPVGGQRAAGEAPDPVAREAARFAAEHPDLTMEVEMADGSITKMSAADYLADAHAEAQRAREDVKLIDAAAQCLMGA